MTCSILSVNKRQCFKYAFDWWFEVFFSTGQYTFSKIFKSANEYRIVCNRRYFPNKRYKNRWVTLDVDANGPAALGIDWRSLFSTGRDDDYDTHETHTSKSENFS